MVASGDKNPVHKLPVCKLTHKTAYDTEEKHLFITLFMNKYHKMFAKACEYDGPPTDYSRLYITAVLQCKQYATLYL